VYLSAERVRGIKDFFFFGLSPIFCIASSLFCYDCFFSLVLSFAMVILLEPVFLPLLLLAGVVFLTGSLSFRCFVWFSCVWLPSADFLSVIASSFLLFTSEDGSLFCCTSKVS